jgi:ATP-binding cassette subfamily B protein
VFRHLHALSLRFHLERQTGGLSRDIERGTRALQSLLSYSLYTIVPTLVEVVLVLSSSAGAFDCGYVDHRIAALAVRVFSVIVTEWRTQFRRTMNELDSKAHSRAIDALYELRDGQVLQQRGLRARRYEQGLEAYRHGPGEVQVTLAHAQHRPAAIIAFSLWAVWRDHARCGPDGRPVARRTR